MLKFAVWFSLFVSAIVIFSAIQAFIFVVYRENEKADKFRKEYLKLLGVLVLALVPVYNIWMLFKIVRVAYNHWKPKAVRGEL